MRRRGSAIDRQLGRARASRPPIAARFAHNAGRRTVATAALGSLVAVVDTVCEQADRFALVITRRPGCPCSLCTGMITRRVAHGLPSTV